MKHRIYSIIGYTVIFLIISSGMQKFGYYINKDKEEQKPISEHVSVYDYDVHYEDGIQSILDRHVHQEIKVLRTAQIFIRDGNVLELVGETKDSIVDWFIAQEGRLKFKKTFTIDSFDFVQPLKKGTYVFQENWLIELPYDVQKHIEFEGVFTYR